MSTTLTVTVDLKPDEADAIVYAVSLALTGEAEKLMGLSVSTSPGALSALARSSTRIGQLAEVNEQLQWRAHWRKIQSRPNPITAHPMVLLDVLAELAKRAEEQHRHGNDEVDGAFMFDEAGRTLAAAFAKRAAGAAA